MDHLIDTDIASMPTVSIITPTYNRCEVLPRAIDSVLEQSYSNWELIIIDDGSQDNTFDVVDSYDDSRIRYIRQSNKGANVARNRGIEAADGSLISFLDSDDEYLPNRIERTVSAIREADENYVGVVHRYRVIHEEGRERPSQTPARQITLDDLRTGNPIGSVSCTLFKRNVIDRIGGFDPKLPASQDYDLYLRALQEGPIIGVQEELMRHYRVEDSISSDPDRKSTAHKIIRRKHRDIISDDLVVRQHYALAHSMAANGDIKTARSEFARAAKEGRDPLAAYHYILTLFGAKVFYWGVSFKRWVYSILYGYINDD